MSVRRIRRAKIHGDFAAFQRFINEALFLESDAKVVDDLNQIRLKPGVRRYAATAPSRSIFASRAFPRLAAAEASRGFS